MGNLLAHPSEWFCNPVANILREMDSAGNVDLLEDYLNSGGDPNACAEYEYIPVELPVELAKKHPKRRVKPYLIKQATTVSKNGSRLVALLLQKGASALPPRPMLSDGTPGDPDTPFELALMNQAVVAFMVLCCAEGVTAEQVMKSKYSPASKKPIVDATFKWSKVQRKFVIKAVASGKVQQSEVPALDAAVLARCNAPFGKEAAYEGQPCDCADGYATVEDVVAFGQALIARQEYEASLTMLGLSGGSGSFG
jgi:hypothetical protein